MRRASPSRPRSPWPDPPAAQTAPFKQTGAPASMRREGIERRVFVKIAETADGTYVGKGERCSRVLQAPLTPAAIVLPIMLTGANLVLANEQRAAIVLMLLVVGELCFQNALLVALGHHFGHEIEALDVNLSDGDGRVDHRHVRFGIVLLIAFEEHTHLAVRSPLWLQSFEMRIEQAVEIRCDPLMNEGRGRHHHGHTIDQLPPLLLRP